MFPLKFKGATTFESLSPWIFRLLFSKNASSNCPYLMGDSVSVPNVSKLILVFLLNTLCVAFIKAAVAT